MTAMRWGVLVSGLLAGNVFAADICEPLREQIEFQIASTGANGFAVIVVDTEADVAGKVVGTCARGSRKLVYVRAGALQGAGQPTRPATATLASRAKDEDVITECRDGTERRGIATCKP
jgi:Protein of unknown function (DUF1161)